VFGIAADKNPSFVGSTPDILDFDGLFFITGLLV